MLTMILLAMSPALLHWLMHRLGIYDGFHAPTALLYGLCPQCPVEEAVAA